MSFYLPSPCLLGSQSMNKPLSSVLGHLLPALIWTMKTGDEDTGWWPLICVRVVSSTGGSDSDLHSIVCTCRDISSLCKALQPTVHSESLVCNGCPFFFFLVFSYLSVCLGKEQGLREQEAISFICNQESLLVPYGQDQIGHICLAK